MNPTNQRKTTQKTARQQSDTTEAELAGLWTTVSDTSCTLVWWLNIPAVYSRRSWPPQRSAAGASKSSSSSPPWLLYLVIQPPILCPPSRCSAQPTLQSSKNPGSQDKRVLLLLVFSWDKPVYGSQWEQLGPKRLTTENTRLPFAALCLVAYISHT